MSLFRLYILILTIILLTREIFYKSDKGWEPEPLPPKKQRAVSTKIIQLLHKLLEDKDHKKIVQFL